MTREDIERAMGPSWEEAENRKPGSGEFYNLSEAEQRDILRKALMEVVRSLREVRGWQKRNTSDMRTSTLLAYNEIMERADTFLALFPNAKEEPDGF